ncbi:bifunctional folylpolyglutamate synthase/dihydrofolate synthase [Candidatus Omnitrophota bacterium]
MHTYEETLRYLDSFVNYEKIGLEKIGGKSFDLDRLRGVLKKLDDPQRSYCSAHIAGTKGKGSVCAFTSSILRESGYRVGLYTSPHLVTPTERISINGDPISREDLASVVGELREIIPNAASGFSFFEVFTLIAMLYFSKNDVDFAVFETGMGGRLDATNVIDSKVCGISPISYDHMHVLGEKIEQIASEKAAIIKNEAYCISSPQCEPALDVIRKRCEEQNSELSLVGKDITCDMISCGVEGSTFDLITPKGEYKECRTGLLGNFQIENCATAVGICERLIDDKIDVDNFKRGIERAFIPGRMEILSRDPVILIDGAQNGESASRLKYSVEQIFKYDKLILLLGLARDKDIKNVCQELAPLASEIVLTRASVSRSADPLLIRGYLAGEKAKITSDVKEGLGVALKLAGKNDLILATGSFYVIGEVRELLVSTRAPEHK